MELDLYVDFSFIPELFVSRREEPMPVEDVTVDENMEKECEKMETEDEKMEDDPMETEDEPMET